jgi:hypothetical protein
MPWGADPWGTGPTSVGAEKHYATVTTSYDDQKDI